jgi:hypothetical protein
MRDAIDSGLHTTSHTDYCYCFFTEFKLKVTEDLKIISLLPFFLIRDFFCKREYIYTVFLL